jgi:solute carrier family 13 (sodium-dependent dicarboxylate transporter), member 2/3/5
LGPVVPELESSSSGFTPARRWTVGLVGLISIAVVTAALVLPGEPALVRGGAIATVYLVLALSEIVPPFVPTVLLLVATPMALGPIAPEFELRAVLTWPADPVLALFAGGFSLGLAAQRHGIDGVLAGFVLRLSRGQCRMLLAWVLLGTAVMSMWMSNIAAAAMVITALRPVLGRASMPPSLRRALLLGVAIGANVGGMATPIGTGPNGIAIAAAAARGQSITFLHWMSFALPLVLGTLALAFVLLATRYRVNGAFEPIERADLDVSRRALGVMLVFLATVVAWLTEPLHGVAAPLTALGATLVLFGSGLLGKKDLGALDWSTLGLIAGGISLGKLIERCGIFAQLARVDYGGMSSLEWLAVLVFASALLSAVMSNTATAALLIPLGISIDASPSTAVIIAIGASFGMPFTISTPPNAMAYGEGGVSNADLFWIGCSLMIFGCLLVTWTGPAVLQLMGVP